METFKDHPQLGRFTLRDEGNNPSLPFGQQIIVIFFRFFRQVRCNWHGSQIGRINLLRNLKPVEPCERNLDEEKNSISDEAERPQRLTNSLTFKVAPPVV